MSGLAPNLFQRRFQDLMEIGRARLPYLAPEWTDHNAHDPGITLLELMAWVAEAQLYSLSRLRRDERAAYAELLGIHPHGTKAAAGLIWSDRNDPNSPASTFAKCMLLPQDTVINVVGGESPTFRPVRTLLWSPGRILKLETRCANGRRVDQTATNERDGLPYLPFGERAGRCDVLALTFECRDESGLFGSQRQKAKGAAWPIGVLVPAPAEGLGEGLASIRTDRSPLEATFVTDDDRIVLNVADDSTRGFLTTGAILLVLDNVIGSPCKFTIELRSKNGFPRPPHALRIEPNVVPILQGRSVSRELHVPNGMPDWSFVLDAPGLRFASGDEPITLEVAEATGVKKWGRCDELSKCGPDESVYELDTKTGRVTFGNGVNGRKPPADWQVFVTYAVSDADAGRVARNRKWNVGGFAGTFGINLDPITGGGAASESIGERREARRRSREDHALVTADDIAAAAMALPLLEVARAWVPAPNINSPRTGQVTLVALRRRPAGTEPENPPETVRWLENIRCRLAPRMPLGSRMIVKAPRYVEFSLSAVLEADLGRNPSAIEQAVTNELKKRLALVDPGAGNTPRQPGVPVTKRDLAAWIRATEGVKRVIQLDLRSSDGRLIKEKEIVVPRSGLPRWNFLGSTIKVKRPQPGRSR